MTTSSHRLLRLSGIFVVVILLGLTFYPGTFASPYVTAQDSPRYSHAIVPESSAVYDESTEERVRKVYRYDELSPTARELVDRTRTAENRRYVPDVCRDFVLICDEYSRDELPEEFTYGEELTLEEALVFVEDGDERYLFQTGWTGHGAMFFFPIRLIVAWLTMLPLAVFVAVVTVKSGSDRVLASTVGVGALVAILGFLAPYVEMNGLVSARPIGVLLLGCVWISILAAGGYSLYQSAFDRERHSPPDGP